MCQASHLKIYEHGLFTAFFCGVIASYNIGLIYHFIESLIGNKNSKHFFFGMGMYTFIINITILGAVIGSIISGFLMKSRGRRFSLFFGLVLSFMGNIINLLSGIHYVLYIVGQLLNGIATGFFSTVGPVYVAETTPVKYKASCIVYYVGFSLSLFFTVLFNHISHLKSGWIVMTLIIFLPLMVLSTYFINMPESPRYISRMNRNDAFPFMQEIFGSEYRTDMEISFIQKSISNIQSLKDTFRSNLRAIKICLNMAVSKELTGVYFVIYYFVYMGENIRLIFIMMAIYFFVPLINLFFLIGVKRKFVMNFGMGIITLSLLISATSEYMLTEDEIKFILLYGMIFWIFGYQFGVGPLSLMNTVELMPENSRGLMSSILISFHWLLNLLFTGIMMLNRYLSDKYSDYKQSNIFLVLALISIISAVCLSFNTLELHHLGFADIQKNLNTVIKFKGLKLRKKSAVSETKEIMSMTLRSLY